MKKEFKYEMMSRPFDIGTYPKDGFLRTETPERRNFSTLVYDRELTVREQKHFSLRPASVDTLRGRVVRKYGYDFKVAGAGDFYVALELEGDVDKEPLYDFLEGVESGEYEIL